jgi:hypothetical protein
MATSGELIETVADILGISKATVTTYYRSLREAGLVAKSGRGPSAAQMAARDAALLLVAAGGSRFEKEPAEKIVRDFDRVRSFSNACRTQGRSTDGSQFQGDWIEGDGAWNMGGFEVPQLQTLPTRHRVADALTALIEAMAPNAFLEAASKLGPGYCSHRISVSFFGPVPGASIELDIYGSDNSFFHEEVGYQLVDLIDSKPRDRDQSDRNVCRKYGAGDLTIIRQFTNDTLFAVANLLKDGSSSTTEQTLRVPEGR